jgi:putative phosphoribosyl transferase
MTTRDRRELRDRSRVFRDRAHAGIVLAEMLAELRGDDARIFAIPAGGVPVAAALARALDLPLGVAVVSKVTPPWNSEVGYGAVAFAGSVLLNEPLIQAFGLTRPEVEEGVAATREKVARRVVALGGEVTAETVGKTSVLVDDGLASGFTMRAAIRALRRVGALRIVIAVPTGSLRTVRLLEPEVDELYCANVRGGQSFAVADAYEHWADVAESEAAALLQRFRSEAAERAGPQRG